MNETRAIWLLLMFVLRCGERYVNFVGRVEE